MSGEDDYLRLRALGETCRRYGAIIVQLISAINDILPDANPAMIAQLSDAIADAKAQLTANGDALEAAFRDLPEGHPDVDVD